jgi:hypothetical protein
MMAVPAAAGAAGGDRRHWQRRRRYGDASPHLRHDGHGGMRQTDLDLVAVGLPDRADHRADGEGRGEPERTSLPNCGRAAARSRSSPTFILSRKRRWKPPSGWRSSASIRATMRIPKKFAIKEYTDEQYAPELATDRGEVRPLVKLCKQLGRAIRIGTNHGSLSDRIMNRFGDTRWGWSKAPWSLPGSRASTTFTTSSSR